MTEFPYLYPIVLTAIHTGLRKTELLSLTWKQVDLSGRTILLHDTKSGKRREIPIDDTLYCLLWAEKAQAETDFVFPNPLSGIPFKDVKHSFASAKEIAAGRVRTSNQTLKLQEQYERGIWRAVFWAIKSRMEAVDFGIETFEEAFLSHFEIPGTTQQIGDVLIPRLASGARLLT